MSQITQETQITPQQAIQYLINAVQVGQKRGTWNLQEASTLQAAVEAAQKIRFLEPQQVPQQTAPQPVQPVQPKVAMSAQRVSPSKTAKPSLPPVPEEPPQTVEKKDIQQVRSIAPQKSIAQQKPAAPQKPVQSQPINLNKPLTAAKAAQIHKISQNLKNLQEVIKQNHQPRQQLTPQILGLDGPVGPEVTITQGPVKA